MGAGQVVRVGREPAPREPRGGQRRGRRLELREGRRARLDLAGPDMGDGGEHQRRRRLGHGQSGRLRRSRRPGIVARGELREAQRAEHLAPRRVPRAQPQRRLRPGDGAVRGAVDGLAEAEPGQRDGAVGIELVRVPQGRDPGPGILRHDRQQPLLPPGVMVLRVERDGGVRRPAPGREGLGHVGDGAVIDPPPRHRRQHAEGERAGGVGGQRLPRQRLRPVAGRGIMGHLAGRDRGPGRLRQSEGPDVGRRRAAQAQALGRVDLGGESGDDGGGDAGLHGEGVVHRGLDGLGPDMAAGGRVDQLRRGADPARGDADAALGDVADPEVPGEGAHVMRLAPDRVGGVPRHHEEVAEARQLGRHVLDDAVGEPAPAGLGAEVGEGQHDDRGPLGRRRRLLAASDRMPEAQPPPRHRHHRLAPEQPAQGGDLDVEVVLADHRVAPDGQHQFVAVHHPLGVGDEMQQQVEPAGAERDRGPAPAELAQVGAERTVEEAVFLRIRRARRRVHLQTVPRPARGVKDCAPLRRRGASPRPSAPGPRRAPAPGPPDRLCNLPRPTRVGSRRSRPAASRAPRAGRRRGRRRRPRRPPSGGVGPEQKERTE